MATEDKFEHARENAKGWLESINEMVDRLNHAQECDEEPDGDCELWAEMGFKWLKSVNGEDLDFADYHDQDKAREAIEESILSLELSGTWAPGETPEASRYEILLTTGGPALRIVGNLNTYNEPSSAQMEMQDWGTPWEYYSMDSVLLAFAQVFYYGD